MKNPSLRFVQISDTHLCADKEQALLGVKTYASFNAVVELVNKDPKQLDFILLTGDLSQDETDQSYLNIIKSLGNVSVPVYWIPGNHDDTKVMNKIFPREPVVNSKHIVLEHWQLILLDSQKPGCVEGYLDATQLNFLRDCLDKNSQHAIIVCHHHPVFIGSAWMDKIGLENADELWEILACYPQVKTILFGHVHQQHEGIKNGIRYYSAPSTCVQFKRNSEKFALEKLNQGFRWLELFPNGEMKTGLSRLEEYVGEFDEVSKGY